jgi:hypothetical protein
MPTTNTAVQQLAALAETLCAAEDTGEQAARQYRWTVGMLERALTAHPELFTPDAGNSVTNLLKKENAAAFLDLAESGALRRRAGRQQGPVSEASMTVVRTRLQGIATAAGLPPLNFPPLQQTDFQPVHAPAPEGTVHLLRDHLSRPPTGGSRAPTWCASSRWSRSSATPPPAPASSPRSPSTTTTRQPACCTSCGTRRAATRRIRRRSR